MEEKRYLLIGKTKEAGEYILLGPKPLVDVLARLDELQANAKENAKDGYGPAPVRHSSYTMDHNGAYFLIKENT